MTSDGRSRQRPDGERHATRRPTEDDQSVSHRQMARNVRDADRFSLQLPVLGRIPFPRPDQLAFYGALAALVAVELVEWPVAVAIGAGHALVSERARQPEKAQSAEQEPE
jgi:hypothetical protein